MCDFAWATRRFSHNGSGTIKSGTCRDDPKPGLLLATKHKSFFSLLDDEPYEVSARARVCVCVRDRVCVDVHACVRACMCVCEVNCEGHP